MKSEKIQQTQQGGGRTVDWRKDSHNSAACLPEISFFKCFTMFGCAVNCGRLHQGEAGVTPRQHD